MIEIGRSHRVRSDGMTRMCSDITINGRKNTLWFAVDSSDENYLSDRADPFVVALLHAAIHRGHDIICEDPMSERLHYGLCNDLIPSLAFAGPFHRITIHAPLAGESNRSGGAVGTGFSGGVDSLYTIMTHGPDCEYPLTHLAVFNSGVFEGADYRENFRQACRAAVRFGKEHGLSTVFVDTNFNEVLPERFLDVYSFRNMACALAVQGLFSVYLLSSGHDYANFQFDIHNCATYDALTVPCMSTEELTFHLSGAEVKRWQKIEMLSDWEPSYKWLHPCVYGLAGECNCGNCRKCARDVVTLYTLGSLDRYGLVFDTKACTSGIAARMGFVLANKGNHLFDETLALLEARHVSIPPAAYVYERILREGRR